MARYLPGFVLYELGQVSSNDFVPVPDVKSVAVYVNFTPHTALLA